MTSWMPAPLAPPVPRPVMLQHWRRLTFLHWRYPPAAVQAVLPADLEVETFDGSAWVGLVPFLMDGVRPPGMPPAPWASRFPETNVRTYARGPDGRGAIWFLSLDASRLGAVLAARAGYALPYFWSRMSVEARADRLAYRGRRRWPGPAGAGCDADVELGAPFQPAELGPLDHFLTARYRLWTVARGRLAAAAAEHPAQDPFDLVEVLLAADQRGCELDHRVAAVVGAADQALLEQARREVAPQQPLALVVVEGLAGHLVLDQLDPVEVALAAHVADDRQVQQLLQGGAEAVLVGADVAEQVLALEQLEVGQRHGARHGMAGEGDAVQEGPLALQEGLHQEVPADHPAHRGVPAGQALGEGDDVGLVAVAVGAEPVPEPAEGADDLVGDQQHAVAVADLADPLEVAGRWREAAAGVLHRLDVDRGDRLGALHQDAPLDVVGRVQGAVVEVAAALAAVVVGVLDPHRAGHQRLEDLLDVGQAGDGQRAHGGAVVGDVAAEDLVAAGLADRPEVLARQLPCALDRLAAAVGEEHAVAVSRRDRRQPLGQLDRARVRVAPQREVGQLAGLLGGGLGQLGAAVADLHHEQPGQPVQVAPAVLVVDVGSVAADDHRDLVIRSVAGHPGEMKPQVPPGGSLRGVGRVDPCRRGLGGGGHLAPQV